MPIARHHVIIAALLLAFAGSVVANIWLARQSDAYYRELNATRLDPLSLTVYPSTDQNALPTESRNDDVIVFFGDSRAASWPPPADTPHAIFFNRGIGAQTTAQVLARYDAHVRPLQPTILVLQVGINDLKTIPLFPERQADIIATCKRNIAAIIERARATQTTVILSTIFPTGTIPVTRQLYWSPAIDDSIKLVNAYLATLEAEDVILMDSFSLLANESGKLHEEYAIDTLHINDAAYTVLNQALADMRPKNWSSGNVSLLGRCLGCVPGGLEHVRGEIPKAAVRANRVVLLLEGIQPHPGFGQ